MSENLLSELWYALDQAYRLGAESSEDSALALARLPSNYDDLVTECGSLAGRLRQSRSDVVSDIRAKSAELAKSASQFEAAAKVLVDRAPEQAKDLAPGLRQAKKDITNAVELLDAKVKVADDALEAAAKSLEGVSTDLKDQLATLLKSANEGVPKADFLLEQLATKRDQVAQAMETQSQPDGD